MDELEELFKAYGLDKKGTFEEFKTDMQNRAIREEFFKAYGLDKKGTFDEFENDLGFRQGGASTSWETSPLTKAHNLVISSPGLVARGAAEVVPSVMEVLGAGEALIGEGLEAIGAPEQGEPLFSQGAKKVREFIQGGTYVEPEAGQSIPGQVFQGVGQILPMMATAGGSAVPQMLTKTPQVLSKGGVALETLKATGKQLTSPAGIIGGSQIAGPEWTAAKESGLSDEEAFEAMVSNYFVGQTEIVPIQRTLKFLNKATGNTLLNNLKSIGSGGLQEAVQESVQTYLTNQIASGTYDPDRDPFFQVVESGTVGGLVGMFIPSIGSVMNKTTGETKKKLQEKVLNLTVDKAINENDAGELNKPIDEISKEAEQIIQSITPEQRAKMTSELNPEVNEQGGIKSTKEVVEKQEPEIQETEREIDSVDKEGNPKTKTQTEINAKWPGIGSMDGYMVEDAAEIAGIYAEKDEKGNVKRGGGLYQTAIDYLKSKGVNTLVVTFQSPDSRKSLESLQKKGIIKVADNPGYVSDPANMKELNDLYEEKRSVKTETGKKLIQDKINSF